MSRLWLRATTVLTLVLIGACAPPPPRFAFKHTERRVRFPNGLRFVLMPDATAPEIEVDVRYDVGSREDPPGKAGLAHLVEHLMFQQRPDGPASPLLMQSVHDLSTSFNAYTTWDRTHYMTGARSANLDSLIKIEAMRMFDIDAAIGSLQKWFGRIARRTPAPRTEVQPVAAARGRVEHALDVEHPSVHVIWPLPPRYTPDGEAVRFGLFSTLFRTAAKADEYDFAYQVQPQLLGGDLAPAFAISIVLRDLSRLDEALAFVARAARSAYRGFDQGSRAEVEEFQNRNKAAFIADLEPLAARTDQVADLVQASGVAFDSPELYVFHELDRIAQFDGARVAAAIKKYVDPDAARVVVIRPSKQGGRGDPRSSVRFATRSDEQITLAEVDPGEAGRPIALGDERPGVAAAQRLTLGSGLEVVLLPIKAMPLVSARLIFKRAGDAATPDSPALARAAAGFLRLPLDAEAFFRTGVDVGCRSTPDATICESAGMSIYQDVVIRGLERLVIAGTYDQHQIETMQKHARGRFGSRQRRETELQRQVLAALYGPDHRYTRTGVVTPEAMDRVHLDAVNEFRRRHYTAGNATLVVVGDFDPAAVERQIRDSFSGWDRGAAAPPVDPSPRPRTGPDVIGVVGDEEPQLRVVIGYPSPAGVEGPAGAHAVLAEMLNLRVGAIRFRLGSTYGVYARRTTHTGPNAYEIGGNVDAERAGESIKAMRDTIAALRRGDALAADFVRARRTVVSELLGASTVTSELAERLGFIAIHGASPSYYRTLLEQAAAASPAQIQALIRDELDPGREVIVVLGDRAHLERAFAEAGITGARFVDPTGK